ncbi:dmX-like protein 2 isoform X2 [Varroa jacobsoni]|uniref:dmX-like protein 2 isoform X2 n=1 Tax=Varroa jacobsoni TaxID=62625 RepID=UPI000BFA1190|nr:dmX-like protein 2 isoform X2 [Varroa jacobsoni]
MNLHQVLTGAVNPGDYCYSVGSVEGVPFTVYAAGCNIVILSSELERVQIIAGVCHGNVQVTSLDCSNDVGKIAAAYAKKISIFEPSPLLNNNSAHKLDYRWVETASVDIGCPVKVISWNISATRLLVATESNLELWNYLPKDETAEGVKFTMGAEDDEPISDSSPWLKSWQIATSSSVHFLKFANDGTMFATAGRNDRLAKVWYETCDANGDKKPQQKLFNFVYLPHPRAVTALSWRHTSKYMPRGCVANMLVTSCKDSICRLWSQTLLPEDGLINLSQIEAFANQQPKVQRHKNKIMSKLKHIKSLSEHKAKHGGGSLPVGTTPAGTNDTTGIIANGAPVETMPSLPSSFSINDFHNFALQGSGVAPGVHFHLAASINAESDIPLVPAMRSDEDRADDAGGHFVLHWLNNKEICFSRGAEKLLHDLSVKAFQEAIRKQQEAEEAERNKPEPAEEALPADEVMSDRSPTAHSKDDKISHSESTASNGSNEKHGPAPINVPKDADHCLGEALESKLEALLKQWHKTSDLLFSVHPIDGSFLVWIVDYLDESLPGAFRQPQVSFNSRISNAIALGDAATMSQNISLYLPTAGLDLKTVLRGLGALESTPGGDATKDLMLQAKEWTCTPTVSMISKHSNGSLNLWYLTFKDEESLTHVLSVTHSNKRVCGHRFRINDITCHPVLPLLLTTSHHNSPQTTLSPTSECVSGRNGGFCSELILWKVESVGPLSKSGGISELARINSLHLSAFSNVAWIPTLLPSSTLGTVSNSPSACFVASDGTRLRVYQALIDARSLLAELVMARKRQQQAIDTMSVSSAASSLSLHDGPGGQRTHVQQLLEGFNIVSLQSTARPGCIIELDAIADAVADWQHTQLLHVFQETLILGVCGDGSMQFMRLGRSFKAYIELQHSAIFREPFYLVVIEKKDRRSVIHMWKLTIASTHNVNDSANQRQHPDGHSLSEMIKEDLAVTNNRNNLKQDLPDTNPFVTSNDTKDSCHSSRSSTPDRSEHSLLHASPLKIVTEKLCEHELPLPDGVEIVHAEPAAGHLSSSNIYPACLSPYLICTACSDGKTRFWRCAQDEKNDGSKSFQWTEWRMVLNTTESAIDVDGSPLAVSAAYSGRVAVAFKLGSSFTRPTKGNTDERYVNLAVAIYECESTGGSEWVLEDTIRFRNVQLPRVYCGRGTDDVDLTSIYDANLRSRVQMDHIVQKLAESSSKSDLSRMLSVPSYATLQTLKKSIIEQGNQCVLVQKSLMQLDWVSSEDGSHILTVALGPKVMLYAPVSYDIAQCNAAPSSTNASAGTGFHRPLLKQRSSMAPQMESSRLRWMQIRGLELHTADGLPALPMQLSWVRDGILVVGMDNEMHVYSQWKSHKRALAEDYVVHKNTEETFSDPTYTKRCLHEDDLMSRVQETQLRMGSSANLTRNASLQVVANAAKIGLDKAQATAGGQTGGASNIGAGGQLIKELLPDFGLFETSRLACPVLPQYHPKQLMELLAFGKIKRVKAILAHLVRCLRKGTGQEEREALSQDSWSKSRTYSLAAPSGTTPQASPGAGDNVFTEEVHLDYVEITSIPPLPLYKLLEADTQVLSQEQAKDQKGKATSGTNGEHKRNVRQTDDYSMLFDDATDNFNTLNEDSSGRIRTHSASERTNRNPNHFDTQQANILTQVLTHCSLPGLSNLDQVHLLALADSVASFQSNITERFSQNVTVSITKHESHHTEVNVEAATEALDDSGLRYLLATRHHTYLMRCLPLSERASLQKQGLAPHSIVWAFHSETQDELIQLVLNQNNLKWTDLKDLGVGWWCKNNASLKRLIERVAKSAFQSQQNPLDASFYYMALKKKNILTGLFRSVSDKKMTEFFQNNFNEDRWRRAALKNAYALLGKQKFKHAAAFFLLANDLKSAVQVCLNNLDDLQLAMILVRLYDGGEVATYPDTLKPTVYNSVLGCNEKGEDYHASQAHPDPFIRSMAYWILKRYEDALSTLLQTDIGCSHPAYREPTAGEGKDQTGGSDPAVFNFYLYLRTHPFVVRRNLARLMKDRRQSRAIMLSGFNSVANGADNQGADTITPLERRLFFTTAHTYFRAGCPPLALEVLSRLPNCQLDSESTDVFTSKEDVSSFPIEKEEKAEDFDWSMPVVSQKADAFDWSQPVSQKAEQYGWSQPEPQNVDAFDWSQPVLNKVGGRAEDFDWSQPVSNEQQRSGQLNGTSHDRKASQSSENEKSVGGAAAYRKGSEVIDIMAQQLKFIACLKIMMEELSTLATGLEVDGGLLRFQLYVWLEKCVAALRQLCHYGANEGSDQLVGRVEASEAGEALPEAVKLRDVLLQDKKDFEDKIDRAARRKHWLKANEALLRTLLSYSALHGAHGGGLAAVRMELNLLLQELQQTRTPQALLASPLPVPTSLPLLAASVASNKTVVADPVRHVQSLAHDILLTITQDLSLQLPQRGELTKVMVLRDLCLSLSACIYQALCDSDKLPTRRGPRSTVDEDGGPQAAVLGGALHGSLSLLAPQTRERLSSASASDLLPTSAPSKWPGVPSLRALMARDRDDDAPKLHTLLCEAFVAVYLSLTVHALATRDSQVLFRLVSHKMTEEMWAALFGGGAEKVLKVHLAGVVTAAMSSVAFQNKASTHGAVNAQNMSATGDSGQDSSILDAINRQRLKWNMKILPQFAAEKAPTSPSTADRNEARPAYKEVFVAPTQSIAARLLSKPHLEENLQPVDYDSSENIEEDEIEDDWKEDVFDDKSADSKSQQGRDSKANKPAQGESVEEQFSWGILSLSVLKLVLRNVVRFLETAGVDFNDLPVASPLSHAALKALQHWYNIQRDQLDKGPKAADLLPNMVVDNFVHSGPAIHKYKVLLELDNTPFQHGTNAAALRGVRRLWNYLVRQDDCQEYFIKYIFSPPKRLPLMLADSGVEDEDENTAIRPIRVIHKDQESISAFCVNRGSASTSVITVATPKDMQELDISGLLDDVGWLDNEAEFDILNRSHDATGAGGSEYLVIEHPIDRQLLGPAANTVGSHVTTPLAPLPSNSIISSVHSHGKSNINLKNLHFAGSQHPQFCEFVLSRSRLMVKTLKKHKVDSVRRLASHPSANLYLSGGQDGAVQLWEWGHSSAVCALRLPGTRAKVTSVSFNPQGNKLGVTDGDGFISLWQVGVARNDQNPFFTTQCHSKQASEFAFAGSSSLLATGGQSSDGKNVCLWDTLLPQRKAMIGSFHCHEHGCSALLYAPHSGLLISAGKKGDIAIIDVRQRVLQHKFQAHDSAVKCLSLDPNEEFFVSGSADGDIKIWSLPAYAMQYSFKGEHSKNSLFRSMASGVTHLYVDEQIRLFSCGADGSLKLRQLPKKDSNVVQLAPY